jgi:hypothetical protein
MQKVFDIDEFLASVARHLSASAKPAGARI